ncbi:MAG: xanthine dehydrogenase accessory protein XdhC [Planctomycetota bacterium]
MASPHGFVERLAELSATGKPFVSVTLVEAIGSTPQDTGSKMLVDAGGLAFGTVGGGRVENKAIEHAAAMLAGDATATSTLLEWNLQRDVGMTCGGVVKLFFEAYNVRPWRVVVFGAGHVAQALVRVLLQLDCRIDCIDPRAEWLDRLPDGPSLSTHCLVDPCDFVPSLSADDFVVCMTMGHRTDRPILEAIFRRSIKPAYLGAIGSAAKRKVLIRELIEAEIDKERAEALRCPIGLPLGSNQPGEIAVSIAAEMIQQRDAVKR